MTQADGLSPRLNRQHQVNEDDASAFVTPTYAGSPKRFFREVQSDIGFTEDSSKSRGKAPLLLRSPVLLSMGHHQTQRPGKRATATLLLIGSLLVALAIVPWLLSRADSDPADESTPSLRALAAPEDEAEVRCSTRREWGGYASNTREQCANVLPAFVVEREGGWLVAVHVDRKPVSAAPSSQRGGLRGSSTQHRSLPHQYFVQAMIATLDGVHKIAPQAIVDVVVFTEGRWGGLVDEVGVPVEWNIQDEICDHFALHCTQSMVLINEEGVDKADALECAAVADVLVASEGGFSVASSFLSPHVKILTDKWAPDEMEMKISLDPASTVAGISQSEHELIQKTLWEYSECSALASRRP